MYAIFDIWNGGCGWHRWRCSMYDWTGFKTNRYSVDFSEICQFGWLSTRGRVWKMEHTPLRWNLQEQPWVSSREWHRLWHWTLSHASTICRRFVVFAKLSARCQLFVSEGRTHRLAFPSRQSLCKTKDILNSNSTQSTNRQLTSAFRQCIREDLHFSINTSTEPSVYQTKYCFHATNQRRHLGRVFGWLPRSSLGIWNGNRTSSDVFAGNSLLLSPSKLCLSKCNSPTIHQFMTLD